MAIINGKNILSVVQTVGTSNVPVEGNPADTPTETLNTIKIDATTYEVGGGKLYLHHIVSGSVTINFYCKESTPFTASTLAQWLYAKNITSGGAASPIQAIPNTVAANTAVYYLGVFSAEGETAYYSRTGSQTALTSITDTVYEM